MQGRTNAAGAGSAGAAWQDRTQKAFIVPKADLKANKYDLSINRYKEVVYEEEQYEPPKEILAQAEGAGSRDSAGVG